MYPYLVQSPPDTNPIPARVSVAIALLKHLHKAEIGKSCPGEPPLHIEGRELLPVEQKVRAVACDCLVRYFDGNLAPSKWETTLLYPNELQIACPGCKFKGEQECQVCEGREYLIVRRTT